MDRPNKEAVIKARCDSSLKKEVEQVAFIQELDVADIVRKAVRQYVQDFKKSTGVVSG